MPTKSKAEVEGEPAPEAAKQPEPKSCFVACPIGQPGTPTRKRTDQVLKYILRPVLEPRYRVQAAHEIAKLGSINFEVINRLRHDDLVIVDLTEHNPNVFYELAVRHAVAKAVVPIIHVGWNVPFDVSDQRTLFYDHGDLDAVEEAKDLLRALVASAESDPANAAYNPIGQAVLIEEPFGKGGADEALAQVILSRLDRLERSVDRTVREPATDAFLSRFRSLERLLGREGAANLEPHFTMLMLRRRLDEGMVDVWDASGRKGQVAARAAGNDGNDRVGILWEDGTTDGLRLRDWIERGLLTTPPFGDEPG